MVKLQTDRPNLKVSICTSSFMIVNNKLIRIVGRSLKQQRKVATYFKVRRCVV